MVRNAYPWVLLFLWKAGYLWCLFCCVSHASFPCVLPAGSVRRKSCMEFRSSEVKQPCSAARVSGKLSASWPCQQGAVPGHRAMGQVHVLCCGKASVSWRLPMALRLEVVRDRCTFQCVFAFICAQLTSGCWSAWTRVTSGSALGTENTVLHELFYHPYSKPCNKSLTLHILCFCFSVEPWLIHFLWNE